MQTRKFQYFFTVAIIFTLATLMWLFLTPSQSEVPIFLSFSLYRMVLNTFVIVLLLTLVTGLWGLKFKIIQNFVNKFLSSYKLFTLFSFTLIFFCILYVIYFEGVLGKFQIYFLKLLPIIILLSLYNIEIMIFQKINCGSKLIKLSINYLQLIFSKNLIGFLIGAYILYLTIMFLSLTRGHDWGDDFAQYILQAISLINGTVDRYIQGTEFTNLLSSYAHSPVTVPWGFPIFLIPYLKIFNLDILSLKLGNIVVYSLFLIVLFKWSQIYFTRLTSYLIFIFFMFNPMFISFQNRIWSDLLFLLCSTISIYFIYLFTQTPKNKLVIGAFLGFFIFYSSFTRSNGYLLLFPLLFIQGAQFIQKENKKDLNFKNILPEFIPYVVFAILVIFQELFLTNQSKTVGSFIETIHFINIFEKIGYYFWLPPEIFTGSIFPKITYIFSLPLMVVGIISQRRSIYSWALILYTVLTIGLYIFFPGQQGIRYIFPIVPIYIVYTILGIFWINNNYFQRKRISFNTICLVLVIFIFIQFNFYNLRFISHNLTFDRTEFGGPYSSDSIEMLSYIKTQTSEESVIVFFKPRAMRLFTDRDSFFSITCQGLSNGDYYVWEKSPEFTINSRQMPKQEVDACVISKELNVIFENNSAVIYKITNSD